MGSHIYHASAVESYQSTALLKRCSLFRLKNYLSLRLINILEGQGMKRIKRCQQCCLQAWLQQPGDWSKTDPSFTQETCTSSSGTILFMLRLKHKNTALHFAAKCNSSWHITRKIWKHEIQWKIPSAFFNLETGKGQRKIWSWLYKKWWQDKPFLCIYCFPPSTVLHN